MTPDNPQERLRALIEEMRAGREPTTCECGNHCFTAISKGYVTYVSPEDSAVLAGRNWYASEGHRTIYAVSSRHRQANLRLHREIVGGLADHINQNGLDNRRENLRPATTRDNNANTRREAGQTGFRGVYAYKRRFRAWISIEGRPKVVGSFLTAEEAARARDAAAVEEYGDFAVLNFPDNRDVPHV